MNFIKNLNKNKIWYIFTIILLFALAVYLRVHSYLVARPLWHDECSLAMSIIHRNVFGMFSPLEHAQKAPAIFMLFTKIFSMLFGTKELALRFIPLISGILSIPLFYYFSKIFISKKWSIILVNFLFAINLHLIYYAQEFKQYSSDVLVFLLLFLCAIKIDIFDCNLKKVFMFGIFAALISMFSFTSLFVIGAYIIYNIYIKYLKHQPIKNLILFITPLLITIISYYMLSLWNQRIIELDTYQNYWGSGFLNINPLSILKLAQHNLQYFFEPNQYVLLYLILISIGFYYTLRTLKSKNNQLLILCIILIIIASFLHIYPIMQRVSLYLIPILLVLFIIPLDNIAPNQKIYTAFICILVFFSIFKYNLNYIKNIISATFFEHNEPRNTMEILSERAFDNDYIIINNASDSEWYYYSDYFNFKTKKYFVLIVPTPNKTEYIKALNLLPKGNNYWFYFVNDYSHSPVIPFLKEWKQDKTVIYEYENKNSYLLYLKYSFAN